MREETREPLTPYTTKRKETAIRHKEHLSLHHAREEPRTEDRDDRCGRGATASRAARGSSNAEAAGRTQFQPN